MNKTELFYEIIDEVKLEWLSKGIRNESFDKSIDLVQTAQKLAKMGFNNPLQLGFYVTPRSVFDKRNILEVQNHSTNFKQTEISKESK